jgi:hypothetical protein
MFAKIIYYGIKKQKLFSAFLIIDKVGFFFESIWPADIKIDISMNSSLGEGELELYCSCHEPHRPIH